MTTETLLEIKDLRTYFNTADGEVRAVDGVTYDIKKGKTLGVVGESGCGKSVTAHSIMQLIPMPPGKIVSGEIIFKGQNLLDLSQKEMRAILEEICSARFAEEWVAECDEGKPTPTALT